MQNFILISKSLKNITNLHLFELVNSNKQKTLHASWISDKSKNSDLVNDMQKPPPQKEQFSFFCSK